MGLRNGLHIYGEAKGGKAVRSLPMNIDSDRNYLSAELSSDFRECS